VTVVGLPPKSTTITFELSVESGPAMGLISRRAVRCRGIVAMPARVAAEDSRHRGSGASPASPFSAEESSVVLALLPLNIQNHGSALMSPMGVA